jgi:regulator of sirC expression with transglutaminase-like and TPR domain
MSAPTLPTASSTAARLAPARLEDFATIDDGAIDIALGAALIARDVYANLDVRALLAKLDDFAAPLVAENLANASTEEQGARLAAHLFGTLGFRGNEKDYYDPRNSLLPDVVDRRLGIPITLAVVYCEVAKRLGIPARGVGFPGHFLVRIDRPLTSLNVAPMIVDPFYGGRSLDELSMRRMLERALGEGAELTSDHLAPASPRAILVRMLTNLKAVYLQRGDNARAHLALDRVVSLTALPAMTSSTLVNALRERGLVAARLGANEAARADLTRVLELDPKATDAAAIRSQLTKLAALAAKSRTLN